MLRAAGIDAKGLGRPVLITDAEGWVTTKTYDDDSNLTSILRPVDAGPPVDEQLVTYEYDGAGNVIEETAELDSEGVLTTKTWFNATNDITFRSEGDNDGDVKLVTKYGYDGSGHLTSVNVNCTTSGTAPPSDASTCTGAGTQDASTNLITTYTYTSNDQLEDETDPLGRVTRHTYDSDGNELSVTQNYSVLSETADRNVVTELAYDAGTTAGKAGLATSLTDPVDNVTTYTYDALGRQLTEVHPSDASIPALTRTTTYDELGNVLTSIESWTGVTRTTTHIYDKANRETSVTDPTGVETTTTYDAAGNAISSTGGGVTTYRVYDGLGRATCDSPTAPPDTCDEADLLETTHTYDPAGNERRTVDPEGVTTNRYFDRAGRLITETTEEAAGPLETEYFSSRVTFEERRASGSQVPTELD